MPKEKDNVIDGKARDIPLEKAVPDEPKVPPEKKPETKPSGSAQSLKETLKQVENIGQTLGDALQGRGNVVMVRVNDETLRKLDMLVDAEITKSRSESAAYLINEGIQATQALYNKIAEVTDQIARLRTQLRETIKSEPEK